MTVTGELKVYTKDFLASSTFKRFIWNTANGFIGVLVIYLSGIDWIYAPLIIAVLNGITKELNARYGNAI